MSDILEYWTLGLQDTMVDDRPKDTVYRTEADARAAAHALFAANPQLPDRSSLLSDTGYLDPRVKLEWRAFEQGAVGDERDAAEVVRRLNEAWSEVAR